MLLHQLPLECFEFEKCYRGAFCPSFISHFPKWQWHFIKKNLKPISRVSGTKTISPQKFSPLAISLETQQTTQLSYETGIGVRPPAPDQQTTQTGTGVRPPAPDQQTTHPPFCFPRNPADHPALL
jgi:hypothetical protein